MTSPPAHTLLALEQAAAVPSLERTLAWAAINSGTGNLRGLAETAATLADAFAALPGTLVLHDPDPVETVAADGGIAMIERGRNLHLAVRPEAPVRVLLTGHMDTVYAADDRFRSCRRLDDGRINGPGVADMKGGIAIILAALEAFETHPLAARLGYDVVLNSDEETGSHGSAALIARAAAGKVAALTFEPSTTPEGRLAGARPGSGNFSITVSGRAAHAGRNPQDGRNAIVAAADLALRLSRAAGPGLSINPARIDGGGPNNVVPSHAVLRVNLRPSTPDDAERARNLIGATADAIAAEHDVRADIHGGFNRPPKPLDPAAERLFALVRDCGAMLGRAIDWAPTGGVCDGNNIAACGVPVVDTMGARGGAIHSEDEFLIPESLPERAQLATLVLLSIAGRGGI